MIAKSEKCDLKEITVFLKFKIYQMMFFSDFVLSSAYMKFKENIIIYQGSNSTQNWLKTIYMYLYFCDCQIVAL